MRANAFDVVSVAAKVNDLVWVSNKSGLKGNRTDVTWPTSSSSDKRSSKGASRFVFTANQVEHEIDKNW